MKCFLGIDRALRRKYRPLMSGYGSDPHPHQLGDAPNQFIAILRIPTNIIRIGIVFIL